MATTALTVGRVVALWRYPVKSMIGEELNASRVGERGLAGDRAYALVESETGKVVSAKNPRKWPMLFDCRAAFAEPPRTDAGLSPVRISLPSGKMVASDEADANAVLSNELGRQVSLLIAPKTPPTIEELWPDIDGLPYQNEVTDIPIASKAPPGTFFDYSAVHLLTTATLDRLRQVYPEGRFEARRFRPNLVIEPAAGEAGFVENAWAERTLSIGEEVRIAILVPAPRCVMTTLPQGDLPKDPGILRAIARHNNVMIPSKGRPLPCVGVFGKVLKGGMVRRGDTCWLE
jgi:uncharacterized protein YcbX